MTILSESRRRLPLALAVQHTHTLHKSKCNTTVTVTYRDSSTRARAPGHPPGRRWPLLVVLPYIDSDVLLVKVTPRRPGLARTLRLTLA